MNHHILQNTFKMAAHLIARYFRDHLLEDCGLLGCYSDLQSC